MPPRARPSAAAEPDPSASDVEWLVMRNFDEYHAGQHVLLPDVQRTQVLEQQDLLRRVAREE